MQSRKSFAREDGQAMTELALLSPALLLILFSIIQFGIIFKDYVALTDAVRAGARTAAVSRHYGDRVDRTKTAVDRATADLDGDLQVSVSSSWAPGSEVEVEGTYPYKISVIGLSVKSGRLHAKTRERVE